MLNQEELRKLAGEKIKEASKSEDKNLREMATEILNRMEKNDN